MRKITLLVILLTVSFTVRAQTFNFDTDADLEGWEGKNAAVAVAGGIMTLTPDNHKNPNIQYVNGIDAGTQGYVHLRLKNKSSIINEIRFVIRNAANDNNTFINTAMTTEDADFKTYDLELTGADGWSGVVDAITIRFTERNTNLNGPADNVEIDYIIFDNKATLNVESLEKFKFSVFPNPAQNEINFSSTQPVEQIQIYSLLGQEVLHLKMDNPSKPMVNIASLSKGIYNMKVKIGSSIGIVKIVKE
ncbi:T9SS type A sorting domain-containing protein [Mariniflexile ostreae]|uniref:T9SS type A sorting domain-containing protein n=1 Tax=Mariniflexile ostreae TaxID=1520892 RepID=A0ABV5FBQ0_9FLAO